MLSVVEVRAKQKLPVAEQTSNDSRMSQRTRIQASSGNQDTDE